jgi:ribosomal protein S18 acetylase RimI-like enzyme
MKTSIRTARPSDADSIARVHVESWLTTYPGLVPATHLAGLSLERRARTWAATLEAPERRKGVFVATSTRAGVVGFANGGPERDGDPEFRGELYAIYLLEAWQGKGLGRRLFSAVVRDLAARDLRSLLVWVLEGNPACRFYETMGGRVARRRTVELGGARLPELGYGWDELPAVTGRRSTRWPPRPRRAGGAPPTQGR